MERHTVKITLPERKIQKKDVQLVVYKNKRKLGTLAASQGSIDWLARGDSKPYKVPWDKFASLMERNGRRRKGRKP